jgi:hypothetical protein
LIDPTLRVPDPGPDDDPRIQAAVAAYAERELAGARFEPIVPVRRRTLPRAAIALAGVAAAAALVVPLIGSQLWPSPVPAVPATSLAQCLAGLTADDVVAGSPKLSVGDLRIVGYVLTRYESGMTTQDIATEPVPVVATDDHTGETTEVRGRASMVLWQSVEPDNLSGDFLTDSSLQRWVDPQAAVPVDPGAMVFASVFQQANVTVTLQVRCGGVTRDLTVTGTNNPVLPDRTTSMITGIECTGPDADVSGYGDELAAFARTCHTLI